MKKLNFLLMVSVLVASSSLVPTPAAADPIESYFAFYTTGSEGSTAPQSSFTWDQKPWLYVKLLDSPNVDAGSSNTFLDYTWVNPIASNPNEDFFKFFDTIKNEAWISFSDAKWNEIKIAGDWKIQGYTLLQNQSTGQTNQFAGNTAFTIAAAPEPASIALFLTGGLLMGGTALRRRRKLTTV